MPSHKAFFPALTIQLFSVILLVVYLGLLETSWCEPRFKGLITNCSMFELDRRINDMLLHPDMSRRDELYQSVFTIHLQMLHVHEVTMWGLNDTAAHNLGRQLVERNGLLIFNTPVSEQLLRETFRCDSQTTYEIYDLLKNCVRLYNTSEPLIREGMRKNRHLSEDEVFNILITKE